MGRIQQLNNLKVNPSLDRFWIGVIQQSGSVDEEIYSAVTSLEIIVICKAEYML